MTAYVYRHYDASDRLLYIGLTSNTTERFARHALGSSWWSEVARTEVEAHETRDEAWRAEVEAIDTEGPLYNGSGRGPGRPPTGKTPKRNFRMPDDVWDAAVALAKARGETMPDVIARVLKNYVHRYHVPRTDEGDQGDRSSRSTP